MMFKEMFNMKEYNEILLIFKELLSTGEIQVTNDSFNISSIKQLLLSNERFMVEIVALKEKMKSQNEKNKNIYSLIQLLNRKKSKEHKLTLNNLSTSFSHFYNYPKYIISLNQTIYSQILANINQNLKQYPPIKSLAIKTFSEELNTIKANIYNNSSFAQFTPKYLLQCIYQVENPNLVQVNNKTSFKYRLVNTTLKKLKNTYGNMVASWLNITDEQLNNKKRRDTMLKLVQESKHIQLLEMCKNGIPNSLRKNIYVVLLNIEQHSQNTMINQNDMLFIYDYYILRDVHRITASENYFLFEENLIKLLGMLIRDDDLLLQIQGTRPTMVFKKASSNEDNKDDKTHYDYYPFPPSGFFPFQGLAFQLAAFTYMSNDLNDYYAIAKMFFAKYLSYLTSFTSNKNSILSLLCTFSDIYNKSDLFTDLRKHLSHVKFDINQIVMYWYMTSFATIIGPESVFKIYDLVIVLNSLDVFVLFALAVIYYKKGEILEYNTGDEIEKCFKDICYDQFNCLDIIISFLNSVV